MERLSLRFKVALRHSRWKGVLRGGHQLYRRSRAGLYRALHSAARHPYQPLRDPLALAEQLEGQGLPVRRLRVEAAEFEKYLRTAGVPEAIYAGIYRNKMLEHFLSVREVQPGPGQVIVDIACHGSPFADTVRQMYGCVAYRQDLLFPPGIAGDRIGGDAGDLPLPDASVDAMVLHNSLEHFEGETDSGFIREAERVLRPGGQVCIVPLDLADRYLIRTDPTLRRPGLTFDEGALVVEHPGLGQRHERFYDLAALQRRILAQSPLLHPSLALVENVAEVCGRGRPMFLLTLERMAG